MKDRTSQNPILTHLQKEIILSYFKFFNFDELQNYGLREKCLNFIRKAQGDEKEIKVTVKSLKTIAKFINPNPIPWPRSKLQEALNWTLSFLNSNGSSGSSERNTNNGDSDNSKLTSNFIYGEQTPDNPCSINVCLLVAISFNNGLNLNLIDPDHPDMMLRLYLSHPLSLRTIATNLIKTESTSNLINMIASTGIQNLPPITLTSNGSSNSNGTNNATTFNNGKHNYKLEAEINTNKIKKEVPTYHQLNRAAQMIMRMPEYSSTASKFKLETIADVIAVTALKFGRDISNSKDPITDFMNILKGNFTGTDLNSNFNPSLPRSFYKEELLRTLCFSVGYSEERIANEDCYELMQISILSSSFFPGILNPINKETYINTNVVSKLDSKECVSFGICNNYNSNENKENNSYHIIEFDELEQTFEQQNQFQDITCRLGKDYFSDLAIGKLYLISPPNLKKIIEKVKIKNSNNVPSEIKFLHNCDKNKVILLFDAFFYMIMYMRGWMGPLLDEKGKIIDQKYPIKEAPLSAEDAKKVEDKATDEVIKFEINYKDTEEGKLLFNLPLLYHNKGKLVPSNDRDEGYTIKDRLNIVKMNSTGQSCIRMSSNWFGASYYRYSILLGLEPKFDIKDLKNIF